MVRITKVHTGAGDGGRTRLLDGTEVGKEHPRVRLYGTIDEVNSQIGVVRMELNRMPGIPMDARNSADEAMGRVQQELFDVGGECSCTPGKFPEQMVLIGSGAGDRLVTEMDSWLEDLEPISTICSGNFPGVHEHSPPTSNNSCWTRPMASSAEFRASIGMPGIRLSSILTTPICELTSSIVP
jgi:cob(I)alamin adenosyltransferase